MERTVRKTEGGAYMTKQAISFVSARWACLMGLDNCHAGYVTECVPPLMYALNSCSPMLFAKRSHSVMRRDIALAVKQKRNIKLPQVYLAWGRFDVPVRSPCRSYEKGNRNRQEPSSSIHPLLQDEIVG
jgi:hypothetical protein